MSKARDLANAGTALGAVTATELGYVDGVTSAIQTQIDTKQASSTAVTLTGTQTLTNKTLTSPVIASVVNNTLTSTTGDMIYASAANTPARLGIGSSAQVLTVASGIPSWATPSSGSMTLLSTTAMTGTSVTLSSISGSYKTLYGLAYGYTNTGSNDYFVCNPNSANAVESASFAYNNGPVSYSPAIPLSYPANTYQVDKTNANNISWFEIQNYASSTNYKAFTSGGTYTSTSNGSNTWFSSGGVKTNSAITSILFQNTGGGSFSTGTILLYGVN